MAIIGTCGNCGGPVEIPDAWYGVQPATPKCRSCGSVPERAFGPVLPMRRPREDGMRVVHFGWLW